MSAQPESVQPPQQQQVMTEEDADAQFATVLWFDEQNALGKFNEYAGQCIAICGERVVAVAPTWAELHRLVDALGDSINQFRVIVRYMATGPNDPLYWR